jgi:hypothetical protein
MNRRQALRVLSAGAGVELLAAVAPDALFALGRRVHSDLSVESAGSQQTAAIAAAAERIIPASDTPGASDANVGPFIERIMSGWYSPAERERVEAGLVDLDARSNAAHGRPFAQCSVEQQTDLLVTFDDEVTQLREQRARGVNGDNPDQHWFSMFKYLTVWGYFTSEAAARDVLHEYPLPGRHDGCAPYENAGNGMGSR